MAVYRESRRRKPLLLVGAVVSIAVLILAGWLVWRSFNPTVPPDPLAGARAKAREAAQGLEVLTIEYPQAAQGEEMVGVMSGLKRAQSAFEASQSDLARIDAATVTQLVTDFAELNQKIEARVPVEEVTSLAEAARAKLLRLAK